MVTYTGKPLVKGDIDPSIRFTGLGQDWAGNGYTLKLMCIPPSGDVADATYDDLIAVVSDDEAADLPSVENLCLESGTIQLKIIGYKSGGAKIFAEFYDVKVSP